jgi:hypothetical protein
MSRRILFGVVVALALALSPAAASAQVTGGDYVRGAVNLDNSIHTTITFNATSDPFGANPAGVVDFRSQAGFFHRDQVTCLNVDGNRATIGVKIVDQTPGSTSFVGWTLNYVVVDGPGVQDDVEFDHIDETGAPPSCAFNPNPPQGSLDPVIGGDLVVFDSPGSPKSKDDCKRDGWRRYGTFRNQGDCIAFVVHQATKSCVFERVAVGQRAFREKYGDGRFDLVAFLRCVNARVNP